MNRRNWLLASIASFFGIQLAEAKLEPTQYNREDDYLYLPSDLHTGWQHKTKDDWQASVSRFFSTTGNEITFYFKKGEHLLEIKKIFPNEMCCVSIFTCETSSLGFGLGRIITLTNFCLKNSRYDEIPLAYRDAIKKIMLSFKPWLKSLEKENTPVDPVELEQALKDFKV